MSLRFLTSTLLLAVALIQPLRLAAQSEFSREDLCKQLPPGLVCKGTSDSYWRTPPTKTVEIRNGVKVVTATGRLSFDDVQKPDSESADAKYKFLGFFTKHQYFLVSGIYYGEEQDYKLISRHTGEVHALRGQPVLSPNGNFFLVVPRWHGSITTYVELYRIDERAVAKVDSWDFSSCPTAAKSACNISEVLWLSPSEVVAFTTVYVRKESEQIRTLRYLGRVRAEDGRWIVNQEPIK